MSQIERNKLGCSQEQEQNIIHSNKQSIRETIEEIKNSEIPLQTQEFIIRLLRGELKE